MQIQSDFNHFKIKKKKEKKKPNHTTKLDPKPMPKLTMRDTQTFVEVLSMAKPLRKTVMYETILDDKKWLLRSLVGYIATNIDYATLEHMVLKYVKQAVGCRFLGASQTIITFTEKESMEKELKEVCSVLKNSFIRFKSWEQKVKVIDGYVWVSILGLPLVGWNRKCIEAIVEGAGKMVGYDITSVSQGLLIGVKELLNATSFMTLCEQISLILDGDEYEILVNELKPDFSPLFATIKHSMDASGTCISEEESCSENTNSKGYKVVGTEATDLDDARCTTDTVFTEHKEVDMESDSSLLLYELSNELPGSH